LLPEVFILNKRPRLLDLFCGAGGASMGYNRAGFDVVGVDISPQPRYPFEFYQADALTFPVDGFDAIHASPPCQAYSITKFSHTNNHPKLIEPIRERLEASDKLYMIENVVGAPLINPITCCGAAFNIWTFDIDSTPIFLKRHRLFETNFPLTQYECKCREFIKAGRFCAGVYGGGSSRRSQSGKRGGYTPRQQIRKELMRIDWMTGKELSQAIPPAYTEYIGKFLMEALS
jgi:DNA (cytosine-5)-methyltransferase 1